MHFSKTYAQLLLTLPSELRDSAIEYRQLKKLIRQVVDELASLGLSPAVLEELLEHQQSAAIGKLEDSDDNTTDDAPQRVPQPHLVYEFASTPSSFEPRLRLCVKYITTDAQHITEEAPNSRLSTQFLVTNKTLSEHATAHLHFPVDAIGEGESEFAPDILVKKLHELDDGTRELVIPLISDSAFFRLLTTALQSLSSQLVDVRSDFTITLKSLSNSISNAARPTSSTSSFHPHSPVSQSSHFYLRSIVASGTKSDLYSWREIFQLYVEAEVFEGVGETSRGERTVEESEKRLQLFSERVAQRSLDSKRKLKLKQSREALATFLKLNFYILHLKRFQDANAEATRKILKKHTKRTALPLPAFASCLAEWNGPLPSVLPSSSLSDLAIVPANSTSLPRLFIQAIGETVLPILPHIDDYSCLICTSIAFKPIRLTCRHLFCVRCLVKLQKRGKGNCPLCRAPTVLTADRSNVDWALLNFMEDWFPVESKAKLKQNEREAAEEELGELGLNVRSCVIM